MAWTLVQKSAAEAVQAAGTTVTPTLPAPSTAGNLLVATLINSNGGATWTLPAGWTGGAAAGLHAGGAGADVWYYPANPGGISSVLCTSSGSAGLKAALAEFNPNAASAPLNTNPFFETDVSGWTVQGGATTFVQSATHVHTGSFAGMITPDGVSAFPQVFCVQSATPGASYTFTPWLFATSSFTFGISLIFYDAAGNILLNTGTSATVAAAWQQAVAIGIAPAGSVKVFAQVYYNGTPGAGVTSWVDDAVVGVQYLTGAGSGQAGAVKTCPVSTGTAALATDMAVCTFHQRFVSAAAITWTDPAGYTLIQSDTASATHHMYGAYNLAVASPGTQTVTGKSSVAADSSIGWGGVAATFSYQPPAAGGSAGTPGLVGAFCNQNIFGPGTTVQQAIADWEAIASRPLTIRRVYYGTSWPSQVTADLLADAAAARKVAISFRPAFNPPSNGDAALLDAFLGSCKNAGVSMDVALYAEAFTLGMTAAQTIAATQFYAAVVRQYYPLVFNTGTYGVVHNNENSYYAGDAYIDKITTDYYCSAYVSGDRLDIAASLADAASPPKPFGIWEFTSSADPVQGQTQQQATAYFGYLQSYFTARLNAGKTNADLILFNSAGNTALNSSPITTAADYRLPLWQSLFDAVAASGSAGSNTVSLAAELDVILNLAESLTSFPVSIPISPAAPSGIGWPQLILEVGTIPATPVAVLGSFILDDPVYGRLDSNRMADSTVWTDITAYARTISVSRPSTRVQGPLLTYQAGTLSVTLDNSDGRFDPDNMSSPYIVGGVNAVHAMAPVRLRAATGNAGYDLFYGFADGWQPAAQSYEGGYGEVNLNATDGFKVLAGINLATLASPAGGTEDAGNRIRRILNAAAWYTDKRRIATGNTRLQATTYGDTALNLMQLADDTEIGELYIDGAGRVVFRNRQAVLTDTRSAVPQAVFGDLPGTPH